MQDAVKDLLGHGRRLTYQPIIVCRMVSRSDVVVEISIGRLTHRRSNPPVGLGGHWHAVSQVGQWKETRRIGRKGFVVLLQNLFKYAQRVISRSRAEGAQGDDSLSGVIDASFSRFWIHRSGEVEKIAVRLLARQEEMPRCHL